MASTQAPPPETITTSQEVVTCDGAGGALGHPRVFLHLDASGKVDCPYCGRHFVKDANAPHGHH